MSARSLSLLLLLLALSACQHEQPSSPIVEIPAVLWPADMDSNTLSEEPQSDGSVAGIRVTPRYSLATFELSDAAMFESSLVLVTWPQRQAVAGHVVSSPGTEYSFGFVPDEPLTNQWYAVVMDVRETSERHYSTGAPSPEPGTVVGEVVRRFYPGSRPILFARLSMSPELEAISRIRGETIANLAIA